MLTNRDGKHIEVCQKMYLHTFNVTLQKLRIIVEKRRRESNICPVDGLGRHSKHYKIVKIEKKLFERIPKAFQLTAALFSGEYFENYLNPDISIARMYRLYFKDCKNKSIKCEKESQYREILNEEFNFSFHAPANNTCAKCDRFNLALRALDTKQEEETKVQIMAERKSHLDLAESAYKRKSLDKEKCKD